MVGDKSASDVNFYPGRRGGPRRAFPVKSMRQKFRPLTSRAPHTFLFFLVRTRAGQRGRRRNEGGEQRAPFEAGFIVERSFFRIIANVPNDRGRGSRTRGTPPCDRSQNSDTITGPQQCRATMQHHQHSREPNPLSVLLLFSFHPLHFHDEAHRAPAVKNLGRVADNGGGRRIRDVATS